MVKKIFTCFLIITFLSGTTGCNIFSWLRGTPSGAEGNIADGKGYLNSAISDEDYDKAIESFDLAMAKEPNNSDARYWHAIAVARRYKVSIADLGIELFQNLGSGIPQAGEDLFAEFDLANLEDMYDAAVIITDDLSPIFFETTTTGEINKGNIGLSYVLNLTLSALLFVAKIAATFKEFGFTIDENGKIKFTRLDSIADVNDLVDTTVDLLNNAIDGYGAISGDVEGTEEFKEQTENFSNSINVYKIEIGVDNDGDGSTDEEWLNGIDDDEDGLIDEDSTGTPEP